MISTTDILYQLIILGQPEPDILKKVEEHVSKYVKDFEMEIGKQVVWSTNPASLDIQPHQAVAAIYFGHANPTDTEVQGMASRNIPILPVVDDTDHATKQLPPALQPLNAVGIKQHTPERIASALLECVSLLPRQRRVFLSYRRAEARSAALQLFDTLSARQFSVFLDTHEISPGVHFQQALWHNLCDCDVLIMLDTIEYFGSRWTKAEFGRALAKNIPILRVGWPSVATDSRARTSSTVALEEKDLSTDGTISQEKVVEICTAVERTRCLSHAVRNLNIISHLKDAAECVGGTLRAIGRNSAAHIELPNGDGEIIVYPQVGVPTSRALHDAHGYAIARTKLVPAVVYDHIGLHPSWQEHMDWLGEHVRAVRWLKLEDAAWRFADWEDRT